MMIDFSPDRLNEFMADGYLIKFHHQQGYGYGDEPTLLIRATCYTLKGIQITDRCESSRIDNEVSPMVFRRSVEDGVDMLSRKRAHMVSELVSKAPIAGGQSCTLIPTHEVEMLHHEVRQQKAENLHLAGQSMKVRNDALRWKALAKKLMSERDDALDS